MILKLIGGIVIALVIFLGIVYLFENVRMKGK